ncbi:MAG: hypothetical protein K2G55_03725, partial [Lachnospiraceae bacterium]|nr:hypothetical protein [Lachnospiraceae bacterium]
YDENANELIVKLVNVSPEAQSITLALDNTWKRPDLRVKVKLLTSKQLSDINTLEKELIQPEEKVLLLEKDQYQMPSYSFSVLRIPVDAKV